MNYLYRTFVSNNPAGIDINAGWYALLGAINGLSVEDALHKICLIPFGGDERKRKNLKVGEKAVVDTKKMRMAMNRKGLTYRTLGALVGYSYGKIADTMKGKKQPIAFICELENILEEEDLMEE